MKSSEQVTILDGAWDQHFRSAAMISAMELRVASPFIKLKAAERLLYGWQPQRIHVLTRFSLTDMAAGVSDISALRFLLERGAQVRGIKHLHSKLYLFGAQRVIVTSANLTSAALTRNLELGFVSEDVGAIKKCRTYFDFRRAFSTSICQFASARYCLVLDSSWARHMTTMEISSSVGLSATLVEVYSLAPSASVTMLIPAFRS